MYDFVFMPGFLSTLTLRRATPLASGTKTILAISIHALLAESDLAGPSGPAFLYNFYPRSPCGERLQIVMEEDLILEISIHALLAESDQVTQTYRAKL